MSILLLLCSLVTAKTFSLVNYDFYLDDIINLSTTGDVNATSIYASNYYDDGELHDLGDKLVNETDAFFNSLSADNIYNTTEIDTFFTQLTIIYNASNISTSVGTHDGGNITFIQTLGEGDTYNVSEVTGSPGFTININFTDVLAFNVVAIRGKYIGGSGHTAELELYRVGVGWEERDEITDQMEFGVTPIDVFIGEDFIDENGVVQFRITHDDTGNINHDYLLDAAFLGQVTGVVGTTSLGSLTGRDDACTLLPDVFCKDGSKSMTGILDMGQNNIEGVAGINISSYLNVSKELKVGEHKVNISKSGDVNATNFYGVNYFGSGSLIIGGQFISSKGVNISGELNVTGNIYTSGNIGVNMLPVNPLSLRAASAFPRDIMAIYSSSGNKLVAFGVDSGGHANWSLRDSGGNLMISLRTDNTKDSFFDVGNIGIGIKIPKTNLHVAGSISIGANQKVNISSTGDITISNNLTVGTINFSGRIYSNVGFNYLTLDEHYLTLRNDSTGVCTLQLGGNYRRLDANCPVIEGRSGTGQLFIGAKEDQPIYLQWGQSTGDRAVMLKGYFHIDNPNTNDAYMRFDVSDEKFAIGLDVTDDKFKISDATTLGTNNRIVIDSKGDIRFTDNKINLSAIGDINMSGRLRMGIGIYLQDNRYIYYDNGGSFIGHNSAAEALWIESDDNVVIKLANDDSLAILDSGNNPVISLTAATGAISGATVETSGTITVGTDLVANSNSRGAESAVAFFVGDVKCDNDRLMVGIRIDGGGNPTHILCAEL